MKRIWIGLLISIFAALELFAIDNNDLSFRITPRFEFVNGSINEYVFNEANDNTDNKESQLDWDLKAIPVFGINADFNLFRYINIGLDGSIGIPVQSGNMQDYDWLNYKYWPNDPATQLTNYSIHDNYLLKYLTFSVSGGVNIQIPGNITITPKIAYYYELISFDGRDGYKTYKQDNWIPEDFSGKVISYMQEMNAMFLGFSLIFDNIPRTTLYADFKVSPKMTFINAIDYHYVRYEAFWDKMSNSWQFKGNIEAQYKFNRYNKAGIFGSIQYIPVSKGDTSSNSLNYDETLISEKWELIAKNGGGTSRLIWSIGLNYSFSL